MTDANGEGKLGGCGEAGTGDDEGIAEVGESWSVVEGFQTCQVGLVRFAGQLARRWPGVNLATAGRLAGQSESLHSLRGGHDVSCEIPNLTRVHCRRGFMNSC
jgi:hypothetical protein